ncbi:MAG: ATP-binding protein [Synergistaceae bacterium]|nr:ATP-binding protein [Synergistaceae bacterium]MBQ4419235.1 ATP-binding protein [Synergistaceae bacterium]MBQ6739210.1 ATP-binding protein [Synergistaceae bacterium]MBQ9581550.1 ATP-binding protein [Synergistaceae bacterium]MBR0043285.1 ATP-binding protein [Synergistaceae bacterium]
MIGIQGSGKSTFCGKFLNEAVRVNLDTLHTRNKEAAVIDECHRKGCDYVIDNTNPTREDRGRYISAAKSAGYRVVGYFMQSRLKDCISRNELREGKAKIPAHAIAATSNKLEMPSRSEGFDELYFVENNGKDIIIKEWREE